jgi:hypothetical protein
MKSFLKIMACSAVFALTPAVTLQPAMAQSNGTDAAIGAAAGALIGSLLFDSNRHQYYYNNGGRHVYVSNDQARGYYQHHDPKFYNQHRGDFNKHGDRFANSWQQHHGH